MMGTVLFLGVVAAFLVALGRPASPAPRPHGLVAQLAAGVRELRRISERRAEPWEHRLARMQRR